MNKPLDPLEERFARLERESNPVFEKVTVVDVKANSQPTMDNEEKYRVEELKISGNDLSAKVKELIRKGNIRQIIIKSESGRTLLEVPLTVGIVGGLVTVTVFPVLLAVGAIGALVARLTLVVERKES
jgi:hypothetical protein